MAAHGVRADRFGGRGPARQGPARQGLARLLSAQLIAGATCAVLAAAGALPALGSAYTALSLRLEERFHTQVPGPPARIALGPQGRDIRFAGEIGAGTAARLGALLAHEA